MNSSEVVYLETVAGAQRRIRAVVNLRRAGQFPAASEFCRQQGFRVYFATSGASGKVRGIRAHPAASAYFCGPSRCHGVVLAGDTRVSEDPELKRLRWHDAWRICRPSRPADPDSGVVCLKATHVTGWWKTVPFPLEGGVR